MSKIAQFPYVENSTVQRPCALCCCHMCYFIRYQFGNSPLLFHHFFFLCLQEVMTGQLELLVSQDTSHIIERVPIRRASKNNTQRNWPCTVPSVLCPPCRKMTSCHSLNQSSPTS